jgi:hypothetical protein
MTIQQLPKLSSFERGLIIRSLEYYINNKQFDPIAGGVPYQEHMQFLLAKLLAPATAGDG